MSDAWDAFAAREPYFAVLTHPRYLRASFDAAAEAEFFESGEAYVAELYGTVRARVAPHFAPLSILEHGCGVGRLVIPFARRAATVTGVDVSPAMIETARQHVAKTGLTNVELLTTAELDRDERTFDLVNSFLVLQRMEPGEGLEELRALTRRVREGGVGVFHLPYRTSKSKIVSLARTARARVPGLNAALNVARGKPASLPFIQSNVYDINEVFAVLQDSAFDSPHMLFSRHGDLDTVLLYAIKRHDPGKEPAPLPSAAEPTPPTHDPSYIDVRKLIAGKPIEELNRTAEEYFASLKGWDEHLAKPFTRVEDTPQLLINFAALLQGLELRPGLTVLEFGAGTGWLARFLTQLGCRVILLDVSPTALKIARELFARMPVIGTKPEPEFKVFDGRRIDLLDTSVDRIVCFDSFHHAPNPNDVLREFGRVLRPGGIAGFAEPGPQHSTTPPSQYEMRTYGVVENDIDIHAIWDSAQALGFSDLKLAGLNVPPFLVTLAEYDDLLDAGDTYARWAESTRAFLHNVRVFFMRKIGSEEVDSRRPDGLRASIDASVATERIEAGKPIPIRATVRNAGKARWLPSSEDFGGVSLGAHLYDADGRLLSLEYVWCHLPRALAPGEEVSVELEAPALEAGRYIAELDCVANRVTWFTLVGSPVMRIKLDVR